MFLMSISLAGKLTIILLGILTRLHIQEYLTWEALYIAVGVCESSSWDLYNRIEIKCNSIITLCICTSFETLNWFSGS